MEDLIKAKDETIAKMGMLKDALKNQVKTFKDENIQLKAQIAELTKKLEMPKAPTYPDLSVQLEASQKELETFQQTFRKMTVEKEKLAEQLAEALTDIEKLKVELEKVPLSPEKLMDQLKTGMFKLGQQNFSIEGKLDQLIQKIGTGVTSIAKTSSPSSYISPGLTQSQPHSQTGEVHVRKPSDNVRKPSDNVRKPSDQVKTKETPSKPLRDVAPLGGRSEIKTLPYPTEAGGAIICPHCGKQDYGETPDQSRILSYVPIKKYAKKYYCKSCRKEWRYE